MKFRIYEVQGIVLFMYCTIAKADLCLCFRIYKEQVFSWQGSYIELTSRDKDFR